MKRLHAVERKAAYDFLRGEFKSEEFKRTNYVLIAHHRVGYESRLVTFQHFSQIHDSFFAENEKVNPNVFEIYYVNHATKQAYKVGSKGL